MENNLNSDTPLVSVLLPVFNSEKTIESAIKSILNQTYQNLEIIIINDGSDDLTKIILSSFTDERIKVLENRQNEGLISSLNKGAKIATGKYIARMDADDISKNERIQKQVDFLEKNPEIGIMGTMFETIDEENNIYDNGNKNTSLFTPHFVHWLMFFNCSIAHVTIMMRTEIFQKLGGYSYSFIHAEDHELWLRAIFITKITNIQEKLVQVRVHKNSISQIYSKIQQNNSTKAVRIALSLFLGYEIDLELASCFRNFHHITDSSQAILTANLIDRFYNRYITINQLSKKEIKLIESSYVNYMTNIAITSLKYKVNDFFQVLLIVRKNSLSVILLFFLQLLLRSVVFLKNKLINILCI